MTGYLLPVTCGECGSPVASLAGSTACGTEARATCQCEDCGAEWLVEVHMRRVPSMNAVRKRAARRGVPVSA